MIARAVKGGNRLLCGSCCDYSTGFRVSLVTPEPAPVVCLLTSFSAGSAGEGTAIS